MKPSEVIRQVKEKVAQEPNVARALDQVKEVAKTCESATESSGEARKSDTGNDQAATNGSKCSSASELNAML